MDVECGEPECPQPSVNCDEVEIALQQAAMEIVKANAPSINVEQLEFPITLCEILTCTNETFYLLEDEIDFIEPTAMVIIDTIVFNSMDDLVPIEYPVDQPQKFCSELFHLKLDYEANGNISRKTWQVYGRKPMVYDHSYDPINRILSAGFSEKSSSSSVTTLGKYSVSGITYDGDGNIESLIRMGLSSYCSNGLPEYNVIDDLVYTYDNTYPNQLKNVLDASSHPSGFKPGGGEYAYDDNGNLTSDPKKGLTIEYNYLNLPKQIIGPNGNTIDITYDASGRKLRQALTGPDAYTQDYISGVEYRDQSKQAVYHEEGRAHFVAGIWQYEYFIKDHQPKAGKS